jgi:2'-5' RNA ligase
MPDNSEQTVIVALLPQTDDWCKIDPAHLTLVVVGETSRLQKTLFNDLAKDTASIAMLSNPIMAKVLGVEVFGDDEPVDVLKIASSPELLAIRNMLEDWDTSDFPFNPHATIGPVGSFIENVPMYLIFDRISVMWGDQRITFWLKKY